VRRWGVAALALFLSTALGSGAIAGTELALTVDDLPTHGALPPGATRLAIADQMIQALKRHAAPGVYGFTNGGQLPSGPELEEILRAWRQAGFVLGNHTYSHLDLTRASAADYVVDIERNEGAAGEAKILRARVPRSGTAVVRPAAFPFRRHRTFQRPGHHFLRNKTAVIRDLRDGSLKGAAVRVVAAERETSFAMKEVAGLAKLELGDRDARFLEVELHLERFDRGTEKDQQISSN